MNKEKTKNIITNYTIPFLLIIILFIPFICISSDEIKYIYYSPIQLIFKPNDKTIIFIIYLLINIIYIILVNCKKNKVNFYIKRILLYISLLMYIVIFKLTSNINLNLLCVFLNIIVATVYLLNFIREYSIENPNK